MNYKKSFVIFFALLLVSTFVMSTVSAEPKWVAASGDGIEAFLGGVVNVASPITHFLFDSAGSTEKSTGDGGFVALMAFLLTVLVIAGVLSPMKIFGERAWTDWGIAVIVALIGVRFIEVNALRAFTLGSEGLVGALFLIVPFIVVATLILKAPSAVRKLLWIVYAVIMVSLLAYNWSTSKGNWTNFYWIYLIIVAVCIVFFLLDGTIQGFFRKKNLKNDIAAGDNAAVIKMKNRLDEIDARLANLSGRVEKSANDERVKLISEKRQIEKDIAEYESKRSS